MGNFFVRRPIVAMVISILTIIIGVVTLQRLPIGEYPQVVPPKVQVISTYQGADAVTVEEGVATPIEQQVNGVEKMLSVKSTNASDGRSVIEVEFEPGSDTDIDEVKTQNRVGLAEPQLPAEVKRDGISTKKAQTDILLVVSITSPKRSYDAIFLSNYALINLIDAISRQRGVGKAELFSARDYGMRIWLRPDRLAALGVTTQDVVSAIQEQNIQAPSGKIGAEPTPADQEFTWTVRTKGRLATPEEFGNIIVRASGEGSIVRVRDVARVELGSKLYNSFSRMNGAPAATIAIYALPGADALATGNAIKALMEERAKLFPPDMSWDVSYDTTLPIVASLEEIVHTLFEAVLLVILVVFLFLQSGRATLIPLLTVPVSLIGAFILFPMLGFSVNVLTMFGLVLAIGIVVDDAIVVVEAVQHHIEHGMSPKEATVKAMEEVSGPVVAIALILIAVFVPVAFMQGITGTLYKQFALTLAASVAFSAINALTLSPALASILLRPGKMGGPLGKFFDLFNRGFAKVTDWYEAGVRYFIGRPIVGYGVLAGIVVATALLFKTVPTGFIPPEDKGIFIINVQLPDAAAQVRTDTVLAKVERVLAADRDVKYSTTVGGYSMLTDAYQANVGMILVSLHPWEERPAAGQHLNAITRRLQEKLAGIPEAQIFAYSPPVINGLGKSSGFQFFLQDRGGGTVQKLADETDKFLAAARQRPELTGLFTGFRTNTPQYIVDVDREKARTLGVPITDVFQTMALFLGGAYLNDFTLYGRTYRVYAQSDPQYRLRPEDLNQFFVRSTRTGQMVPLGTLVRATATTGPDFTVRYQLYRSVEITGQPAPGYSSGEAIAAMEEVAAEALSPDMGYEWAGMSREEKVAGGQSAFALALSFVFVFLLLAAQYESWALPLSVILGIPFAVMGALFAVWVMGMDNALYVQIGLVMLVGLAAKNAILIVEFAKMEHEAGKSLVDSAVSAARLRLRPILMTSFAFLLGVVPLMMATGSGAVSRRMMGTAVFGGMFAASSIGLFLIPMCYTTIQGLAERFGKKKGAGEPQGVPAGPGAIPGSVYPRPAAPSPHAGD